MYLLKNNSTGWLLNNGPPNTKRNVFFNKRLILTSKFGMLGFLGIENLQQKFGGSISKIVDFFLMSNFCKSLLLFTQLIKSLSKDQSLT